VSLTTIWQQVTGPGTVAFADASLADTTATLSASGNYTLRLAANDSAVATFDDVSFTGQGMAPIESWRVAQFGADANNPAIAGDNADIDRDDITNLVEYALNLDPHANSLHQLPISSRDGNTLSLTYRRNIGATDVTVVVEASDDLNSWSPAGVSELVLSNDGQTQIIEASIATAPERCYLRVRVTH
jgi:hypothetical protein